MTRIDDSGRARDQCDEGRDPLRRALAVTSAAADVGFDWPTVEPVFAKLDEEIAELREALRLGVGISDELGDLLFTAVNLARHLSVDPSNALDGTTDRFEARFAWVGERLRADGRALTDASLAELDALWDAAKARIDP